MYVYMHRSNEWIWCLLFSERGYIFRYFYFILSLFSESSSFIFTTDIYYFIILLLGEWKEGQMHGRGDYSYANGCRYSGDWKDSKRIGKGLFIWPDESIYNGDWENDLRSLSYHDYL